METQPTAERVLPAPVRVFQKCPACDDEIYAPPGSLCERCCPDTVPLFQEEETP